MDFDINEFWYRLKKLIKENGLTQKRLSEKMGLPARTIETWINQKTIPNAQQLNLFSEIFGVSIDFLVMGKTTNNAEVIDLLKRAIDKLA